MMKQVLLLSMLLLVGSCEGRELLRRDNNEMMDAVEMEVEFDYSGQRRELAWGSGFSWFLYTMKLCKGPGKMCPSPPCGGAHHKSHPEWGCHGDSSSSSGSSSETSTSSSETATTTEEYYEYIEEEDEQNGNRSAASASGGFSTFSVVAYLVGGVALAALLAGIIFKKRRGALDKQNLEGCVARRLKLVNSGEEALAYSGKRPPSFIEMPATTTSMAESGSLSTNYINV